MSKKISELTEVIEPSNSDVMPVVNSSTTKKITLLSLIEFIKTALNSVYASITHTHKTSELENDSNFINTETDPTVPAHVKNITEENITSWNGKQDQLTAGANITIVDNVISSTGGGEGGTTDYTALTNKPQINGVELTGNKTSADLGIEETDPTVPTHVKNIAESDITNWNNKQDKLTAGANITIENNVISATGGGSGEINDVYTYEEQEVGTWVDGKTIYRRVIRITDLPSTKNTNKDVQIGGLYKDYNFISIRGVLRGTWGTYTLPFANQDASYVVVYPVAAGDNADTSPLTLRLKASYVLSTSFSECFAILEYTKNT